MFRRFLLAASLSAPLAAARAQAPVRLRVASKLDTEGQVLGHVMLLLAEREGIPTEARLALGPTRVVRAALLAGEVDFYPEYTGNAAFFHDRANDEGWRDPARAHAMAAALDAPLGLVWLARAPASNAWAIAVRRDLAARESLRTVADLGVALARGVALRLAASAEFVESPAALPAFERTYGFVFPRAQITVLPGGDTAVTARAAAQGLSGVNAAMVYGTDGAPGALGLMVLEDPRNAQVAFEPAPVARAVALERFPAIRAPLEEAFGRLDLATLRALNATAVVEGRPPREVARGFLVRAGLLR